MRELPVNTLVRFSLPDSDWPRGGRIVYQARDAASALIAYHVRDASCGVTYRLAPHLVAECAERICFHCGSSIPKES